MLVNSQKFNYRYWSVCLILLASLALASCGRKADETADTNNPGDSTAQITPGSATGAKDRTGSKSKDATLSAEAKKLGVKPASATTCPPNAPIKGNVNKNKKIFHEAKDAGFDKIKPELCFKDAATAKKAGFVARKAAAPKTTKTP